MVISLVKLQAGACPLSWQEGASVGSQVREEVATGLRCVGLDVTVFGIVLTSVGLLLDDGHTSTPSKALDDKGQVNFV